MKLVMKAVGRFVSWARPRPPSQQLPLRLHPHFPLEPAEMIQTGWTKKIRIATGWVREHRDAVKRARALMEFWQWMAALRHVARAPLRAVVKVRQYPQRHAKMIHLGSSEQANVLEIVRGLVSDLIKDATRLEKMEDLQLTHATIHVVRLAQLQHLLLPSSLRFLLCSPVVNQVTIPLLSLQQNQVMNRPLFRL